MTATTEKDIQQAITGLFAGLTAAKHTKLDEMDTNLPESLITGLKACFDRFDFSMFNHTLLRPIEEMQEALIRKFTTDEKVIFLIQNFQFLEEHFVYLIKAKEGFACSADKSSTIMRALARFLITGQEIKWNYDQEYTYGLPKEVFATHEEVIVYFDALHSFHWGNPEKYFTVMSAMLKKAD